MTYRAIRRLRAVVSRAYYYYYLLLLGCHYYQCCCISPPPGVGGGCGLQRYVFSPPPLRYPYIPLGDPLKKKKRMCNRIASINKDPANDARHWNLQLPLSFPLFYCLRWLHDFVQLIHFLAAGLDSIIQCPSNLSHKNSSVATLLFFKEGKSLNGPTQKKSLPPPTCADKFTIMASV